MKRWQLGAMLTLGMGLVAGGAAVEPQARDVTWLSDFDSAAGIARQNQKPVFLVFR